MASNSDVAVWRSGAGGGASDASVASSSFVGYLAPRFAVTRTPSPSWFIPTPTPLHLATFTPPARPVYGPEDTAVTEVERSIRVPSLMLYRTGKLWYVEGRQYQMADVPYLDPAFSLTLISPRFTAAATIEDHTQRLYHTLDRQQGDIDSLIQQMTAEELLHSLRYLTLMPGLLLLPAFDATYAMGGAAQQLTSPSPSSSFSPLSASLSLSAAGLSEGGLKAHSMPRGGEGQQRQQQPHFLLSAHRPFLVLVRHRLTNAVALIAKVEQVREDHRTYRYKERRVQWVEDKRPIQQFV